MSTDERLAPPRAHYINPEYMVPLSPPSRPPFSHYHSSSTLPATPHTPYPAPLPPAQTQREPSPSPLKPYLGLPGRLLLTTLSPALLPLILTIAHLIHNRSSTASLADSLRASLMSACSGLATGAAALTTMPRYLAMQTNEQAVRATQASILAIGKVLIDCVTIVEVVVTFILDTYRSLLLCTIELAVRGSLELVIGAVQNISEGITNTLNSVRSGIQSDIASANGVIQSAVDRVNSLANRFNINISVPEFSIPSLSLLENVGIPTGLEDGLVRLNQTIPTLTELRERLNALVATPFEALKLEMNETRLEMAASFNSSVLPVPPLAQLSASKANEFNNDLCGDLDTSLIDDTAKALHKLSNVAIGLMFLLLFLVWAALCIWEWRRWKAMVDTVETIEEEWKRDDTRDAWRVVAIVEHPVLEKYGSPVLARIAPNRRTRSNLRWYLSYLAHPTCLALLFIASLGFLSIQFQLLALNAIKDHARDNANATVEASTNSMTAKLNDMALASSQQYATDFNAAIDRYQDRIDNELFGNWLNTTAITLNSTLGEFYDGIEEALNTTFGGTILFGPINTFMYCILGSKIDNLQTGLTWISENAKVTLPKLPPDVLLLSPASMNEIAQPISAAAVGSSSGDDEGVVGNLIRHFENALKVERTFYGILLGVWLAFALFGLAAVLWHSGGSDRYDRWRGDRGYGDSGAGAATSGKTWPWEKSPPIYAQHHHSEEERQFRGTSPVANPAVPRIIEPDQKSFLDYDEKHPTERPSATRKGTFGSMTSLVAPGQAFLKLTGGGGKSDDGRVHLTDGTSSEKYNSYADRSREAYDEKRPVDDGLETPPPFWVNRWYRAVDTAKSLFPTRGQKHGTALTRNTGTRTERWGTRTEPSFGASQLRTPAFPPEIYGEKDHGEWTMVDPHNIGRAMDGVDDSRYPAMTRGSTNAPSLEPTYPRRLSRAPTLPAATHSSRNIFDDPPALPSKKHDSIDYLYESEPASADGHYDPREMVSPSSSAMSYNYHDAHVESANKVQTGTAALAAILKNMDREPRSRRDDNPFGDARGGRI